jgi:S-adenosylmethionine:tRNA ribosyltransferase-isomerase
VAVLLDDTGDRGRATIRIESEEPFEAVLEEAGEAPLPPYIRREQAAAPNRRNDRDRYQTVYARTPGAVAAPTAGLHFTEGILTHLQEQGVEIGTLTLHVGLGTFRPVTAESVEDHLMEKERYEVPADLARKVTETRARGGRVVAVGSTSVRTLETVANGRGGIRPGSGRSGLYIYPPYAFQVVDAMLTNFHLPCSTLLMMISALAGRERVLAAYRAAIAERYRFYSYGDCMLIL